MSNDLIAVIGLIILFTCFGIEITKMYYQHELKRYDINTKIKVDDIVIYTNELGKMGYGVVIGIYYVKSITVGQDIFNISENNIDTDIIYEIYPNHKKMVLDLPIEEELVYCSTSNEIELVDIPRVRLTNAIAKSKNRKGQ